MYIGAVQGESAAPAMTSDSPAAAFLNILQDGNVVLYDITGDSQTEMLVGPNMISSKQGVIHVYTAEYNEGTGQYTAKEILNYPGKSTHTTDYTISYTDDGCLIIRWGGAGQVFYNEYQYSGGEMTQTAYGEGYTIISTMSNGWTYTINDAAADEAEFNQRFYERPGIILLKGEDYDNSAPLMIDANAARQNLTEAAQNGSTGGTGISEPEDPDDIW